MGNEPSACGGSIPKYTDQGNGIDLEYALSTTTDHKTTICQVGWTVPDNKEFDLKDHSLFALLDGGATSTIYIREHLMSVLFKRPEMMDYARLSAQDRVDKGVKLLQAALTSTFYLLDAMLVSLQKESELEYVSDSEQEESTLMSTDDEDETNTRSTRRPRNYPINEGCTGVVVLITPHHIVSAQIGRTRALLRRAGKFVPLAASHSPHDVRELLRIEGSGNVVENKCVGGLTVSRAFGYATFKQGDKPLPSEQAIVVTPDMFVYPRNTALDEYIVMANLDGNNQECADLIQTMLAEGESNLANICREAVDVGEESLKGLTFMLVGLPGMKRDRSATAQARNLLWGSRTVRSAQASQQIARAGCLVLGKELGIEEESCECS